MIYSKFIKDLGDKTGIPLRTIEAEWKVAERQLNFDVMMEPNKYSHLKRMNGTMAEEIARRVEKTIINPQNATDSEKQVVPGDESVPVENPTEELEQVPEGDTEPDLSPPEGSEDKFDAESVPEGELPQDTLPDDELAKAFSEDTEKDETEPESNPETKDV